jgi:outer membrane protein assembly factor BamB
MNTSHSTKAKPSASANHRIRPAIIIVSVQWTLWFILPLIFPGDATSMLKVFGGLAGGLAILIWWLFFSRVVTRCRWVGFGLMILSVFALTRWADPSISTGYQGIMLFNYVVPTLSLGLVLWATFARKLPDIPRRLTMLATIILACGFWTLFRSEGITGSGGAELAWRWSMTHEEKFTSDMAGTNPALPVSMDPEAEAVWPGFRGPGRNAVVKGIKVETDWSSHPPEELWRKAVGPGCSSFAIMGDYIFTQEQREDNEAITCYQLTDGTLLWSYEYEARFWDSHAGAGPRSTPAIDKGKVYALGATGILNAVEASSGQLIWTRDAAADTEAEISEWGFAGSPLVIDDLVLVTVGGTVAAYDTQTGELSWMGPDGGEGYSSPHLLQVDDIPQLVIHGESGVHSFEPKTGKLLWEYAVPAAQITQPGFTARQQILISVKNGMALQCLSVNEQEGRWELIEEWSSTRLKPNFNDYVVHQGFAYGYDGMSLVCIDLADGSRKWKSGIYGGQLLLLADQDLLLVLSEKGEISLIEAISEQFSELGSIPAIEGKTWNHPAMAGNILLVRNSREMAAYRL